MILTTTGGLLFTYCHDATRKLDIYIHPQGTRNLGKLLMAERRQISISCMILLQFFITAGFLYELLFKTYCKKKFCYINLEQLKMLQFNLFKLQFKYNLYRQSLFPKLRLETSLSKTVSSFSCL